AGFAGPPVVSGPDGVPCSTIVRTVSVFVKALPVCCPQLVNPETLAQSPLDVQGTGRHGWPLHAAHGVPILHEHAAPDAWPLHRCANLLSVLSLQKPQNTFV